MKEQLGVKWQWKKLTTWGKIWHVISIILSLLAVLVMCAGLLYIAFLILMMGSLVLELKDVVLKDLIHWISG